MKKHERPMDATERAVFDRTMAYYGFDHADLDARREVLVRKSWYFNHALLAERVRALGRFLMESWPLRVLNR